MEEYVMKSKATNYIEEALHNRIIKLEEFLADLHRRTPLDQEMKSYYTELGVAQRKLALAKKLLHVFEGVSFEELLQDPNVPLLLVELHISKCKDNRTLNDWNEELKRLSEKIQERVSVIEALEKAEKELKAAKWLAKKVLEDS